MMNSAMTPEASVCPAVRAGNVAQGTPCVVWGTAAAMVSRGSPILTLRSCCYSHSKVCSQAVLHVLMFTDIHHL